MDKGTLALLIAAGLFAGACATPVASTADSRPHASKAAKEDFTTGSRIPRSADNENYQGVKSTGRMDYQDYLDTLGRRDKMN